MKRDGEPLTPVERSVRNRRRLVWLVFLALLGWLAYWLVVLNQYVVAHKSEQDHFLHGSIGAETANGLPYWVFKALPEIYRQKLGDEGWGYFGLITLPNDDLPLGFSRRVVTGIERVWFNCSLCHVGTYRVAGGEQRLIAGAPSNNLRLQELIAFMVEAGRDPGFTADSLMTGIQQAGGELSWPERLIYRHLVFAAVKTRLQWVGERLAFLDRQEPWGPGRVDTFNPYKAIQFNFPMDEAHVSAEVLNGSSDYPSIWQQNPREGMNLHWDGNNDSVAERNLSAALGAGVTPVTVDREAIRRIEEWMWHLPAPRFPGTVDEDKARRGEVLYTHHCAACHGRLATSPPLLPLREPASSYETTQSSYDCATPQPNAYQALGADQAQSGADRQPSSYGEGVFAYVPAMLYDYDRRRYSCLGKVVALDQIGTDPGRWRSYTREFSAAQNLLYAGYNWRFHRFRKTEGYASHPLDGIWARAPYLHNGSVPTLRDLLQPPDDRPMQWYRGSDELDLDRVGYRYDSAAPGRLFLFDTTRPGNGNSGHDYGTALSSDQKDDIVEYMKKL